MSRLDGDRAFFSLIIPARVNGLRMMALSVNGARPFNLRPLERQNSSKYVKILRNNCCYDQRDFLVVNACLELDSETQRLKFFWQVSRNIKIIMRSCENEKFL